MRESILFDGRLSLELNCTNTVIATHHFNTNRTLFHSFFVNEMFNLILYDQISAPCFSKHNLISLKHQFNIFLVEFIVDFGDVRNVHYSVLIEGASIIN